MIQESATGLSPSRITGTFSEPCGAIAAFSVKRHGIDSAVSPLCASAIRVRQQYGLNGRVASAPTSSNSFSDIDGASSFPIVTPRFRRGIQYAGPLVMDNKRRCLLDHSHARMMTARLP